MPLEATDDDAGERLDLTACVISAASPRGPLLDHVGSTMVAGVKAFAATSLDDVDADVMWIDIPRPAGVALRRAVRAAAERGALVIVLDATLVAESAIGVPPTGVRFPAVPEALRPLQTLVASLLDAVDDRQRALLLGRPVTAAVRLAAADVLAESDGGAWCARLAAGAGEILWLGVFPELKGAGFRVEEHSPLRATACQLLVDEVLAYGARRKHGVSVRKVFGPYGAPMMAWQAHVEETGGVLNNSMDHLVSRLANSRQVPSFSLIRRTFRWGQRVPGVVCLAPAGDPGEGVRAQPDGPAFFSGQWITLADGSELGYPGAEAYVDFHQLTPELPRLYPAPIPRGGLALGTPAGRVEVFSVSVDHGRAWLERRGALTLSDGTPLEVAGASPTFGTTGDGAMLVVADHVGDLHVYAEDDAGWTLRARYAVGRGARVSPRLVDWTGSGTLDLMVGTEEGTVDLFEDFERLGPARRTVLFETACERVAPWPMWSPTGPRVLFGDLRGGLRVWERGAVAMLRGVDTTMAATTDVYLQQDSVPVVIEVGGRELLIAGASIVGRARTLGEGDDPATVAARRTLARLRRGHIPCNAHLFLLQGASLAEVSTELRRHRESFAALGMSWEGTGANEHGWWMPRRETALAFLLQHASGLRFNFGWQSPGTHGAPDFDVKYSLAFPFFLRASDRIVDFVLHAPALPDRFPRALELMAACGLPLTFFVHPEYRQEGSGATELDGWIGTVEALRRRHAAVFVTENQMAAAIAVSLASQVRIVRDAPGSLRLEADTSDVPAWAEAWRPTLAVAVEWPGRPAATLTGDGVSSVRGARFVTSVGKGTTVRVRDGTAVARWSVTAANVPISIDEDGVETLASGFQELHLAGADLLVDWPGAHVRETEGGLVLTRFGQAGRVGIRVRAPDPSRAGVPWSPHDSKQDRWIIDRVFRGRTAPGYFVEIGAADGVSTSSTWALEHAFGWTGIAVEPNYLFFEQLRRNRRCHMANVAATELSGPLEFIQASWFGRIRQHFVGDREERDHLADPYLKEDLDGTPAKVVKMPGLSLEDLLLCHGAPQEVDFVSVDAEFSEWFILRAFPFHRIRVLALCTRSKFPHEGAMKDSPHAADIRRLLCGLGYLYDRELSRNVQYDFFVHPEVIEPPLPDTTLRGAGNG